MEKRDQLWIQNIEIYVFYRYFKSVTKKMDYLIKIVLNRSKIYISRKKKAK